MRLFTWNGRAGSASGAWPAISRGSDIVFLQEIKPPAVDARYLWDAVPGRAWGSAIVLKRGTIEQIPLVGYEGWVTGGRIRGLGSEFFAFSVHVPYRKPYAREAAEISARLRRLVGRGATTILAGDFNIAMGRRPSGDTVPMSAAEHKALDKIAAKPVGLVSLWERCNPGQELAQTLRWMKNPVAKYHCDGFLVPEALLKGATCVVLDTPEIRRASDHNPVIARVRL